MFKINPSPLTNLVLNTKNSHFRRFIHKENHWSVQKKKRSPSTRALEHFDEVYENAYRKQWPQIRKALLGKQKYVAVINNYSDSVETSKFLEDKGAFNMRTTFNLEKDYLIEEHSKIKWQKDLEKIWKSEKTDVVSKTDDQTIETNLNFSLNESLKNAQYDFSRIIDEHNPTAVLYDFVPATKLKGRDDFIPDSEKIYSESGMIPSQGPETIVSVKEYNLHFPENLNVYCFEEENLNDMPSPRKGSTGVLNYYLMDGGSVLPVLALDLKPGSRMLDMCAAPGGKSIIALQTLYLNYLQCNDISISRTNRLFTVMKQYLYDFQDRWLTPGKVFISQEDARLMKSDGFDRILVDVPCTTDRHSAKQDDNNIFRADRIKERLHLPEMQTELLVNALQLVRPGGIVVYSTCSLSPIQNEGVVQMALKRLWEDTAVQVEIRDLNPVLGQFRNMYKFASPKTVKYGHVVLPMSAQNYGPTYFCKLHRIK